MIHNFLSYFVLSISAVHWWVRQVPHFLILIFLGIVLFFFFYNYILIDYNFRCVWFWSAVFSIIPWSKQPKVNLMWGAANKLMYFFSWVSDEPTYLFLESVEIVFLLLWKNLSVHIFNLSYKCDGDISYSFVLFILLRRLRCTVF